MTPAHADPASGPGSASNGGSADGPTTRPAGAATTQPAVPKPLIDAIAEADHPDHAAAAYSRACSVNRMSVPVQRTYLERMLRFGLARHAMHPARALIRLGEQTGLAHGTLAYMDLREGRRVEALVGLLHAAAGGAAENAGVMDDLGQLMAWFEQARPSLEGQELPAGMSPKAPVLPKTWEENKHYADGHKRVMAAYAEQTAIRARWDGKIELEQKKIEPLRKRVEKRQREYDSVEREKQSHERELDRNRREARDLRDKIREREDEGRSTKRLKARLNRLSVIRTELKHMIELLELKLERIRIEGMADVRAFQEALAKIDGMRDKRDAEAAAAAPTFDWKPPAVGGVIPEYREHYPRAAATTRPAGESQDDADQADRRLALAKLYLANDLEDKARQVLADLAEKYPGTNAAQEARVLLRALGNPK